MAGKKKVDNIKYYKHTGSKLKDKIYNGMVKKYTARNKQWNISDTIVWQGAIYEVPGWISYILQIGIFWWLAMIAIKYKGDTPEVLYGVIFLLVILIVRISMLQGVIRGMSKDLEQLNKKL